MNKKIPLVFFMFMISIVIPLFGGFTLNLFHIKFVSIPIHALLETAGALMAFTLGVLIVIVDAKEKFFSHFHYSVLALISMGIFDLFHAAMMPGKLFVWLHSMAVFFGGLIFMSVWLKEKAVSTTVYYISPVLMALFSVVVSVASLVFPELIPMMLINGQFSDFSILLNMIGGVAFFIAGVKFLSSYLRYSNIDDLLFTGHTFLFGISGVLFASSALWELSWWLWHVMRFIAYVIALYYAYVIFIRKTNALYISQKELLLSNKQLSNALSISKEYQKALEVGSIVSKSDLNGKITYVNQNLCILSGYTELELLGQDHNILRHPNTPKELYADLWKTIQNKQIWKGIIKNIKKNRTPFYTNMTVVPLLNQKGDIEEYLAFREDVTDLVKSKQELRNSFHTDSLTSLGNRFKFLYDLNKYSSPAVALVNIDEFKELNKLYGREIGDKALIEFSNYLFEQVSMMKCSLYRLHGNEFAILKEIVSSGSLDEFVEDLRNLVKKVNAKKFLVEAIKVKIAITVSVAHERKDKILLNVDIAMKIAQEKREKIIVFSEKLNNDEEYKANILCSNKIKEAINSNKIISYFQPVYNIKKKQIEKYETLMRLVDESEELICPDRFLQIAKKSKQYCELSKIIIDKAFDKSIENPDMEFSINLSIDDIMYKAIREFIKERIGMLPNKQNIIFEIIESDSIENLEEVSYFIEWVKKLGCKIAIDNFGVGYSNFSYLLNLKADYINIDGSLIQDIDRNNAHKSVVESIVSFAKKNDMLVIAKYVHSQEVFEVVEALGVDFAQGYFIGKPAEK